MGALNAMELDSSLGDYDLNHSLWNLSLNISIIFSHSMAGVQDI